MVKRSLIKKNFSYMSVNGLETRTKTLELLCLGAGLGPHFKAGLDMGLGLGPSE